MVETYKWVILEIPETGYIGSRWLEVDVMVETYKWVIWEVYWSTHYKMYKDFFS